MAVATLLMSNCSQEEIVNTPQRGTNTLTATIEGSSRSAVSDGGIFSWTSGDKISVYNGTDFTEFMYSGSGNAFSSSETITPQGIAIYPANDLHSYDNGTASVSMATSYTYGSTNAPMLADVDGTALDFKHLGGLMRFVVKNVPSTATSFTFTANSGITGCFEVSESTGEKIISAITATESNKTVTVNFTSADIKDIMTFYIPLPTGTYSGYTVSVGDKSHTTDIAIENEIKRGTLLLMPTFTYSSSGLSKGEENIVIMSSEETVNMSVADGEEVTVNVAQGATATLNLIAPSGSDELTISDGSDENTESQVSSNGTLNVSATNSSLLNINTPTLTVKLTSGTYDKVEALTAKQTLIIGENVTIGELVLKGGNVKLEGNLALATPLVVDVETTIDLNGYTIKPSGTSMNQTLNTSDALVLVRRGGKLTITDNSENKTGCIDTGNNESIMGAIKMTDGQDTGDANASLIINGGTIKGYYYGVMGNGNRNGTDITINGGTIEAGYCATDNTGIFHPQSGTLTITDANITGYKSAVEMRSGTLTISGGTFESTGTPAEAAANGNGNTIKGAAIAVSQHTTNQTLSVTISDGTFTGVYALYEEDKQDEVVDGISMSVTGGTFNGAIFTENCPKAIVGGTFADPSACYYLGTNANVSVNMVADYTGAGFKTESGQTVALNIAEDKKYTVKAPLVGSAGTQTLGFQFKQGSTVTIDGGTITSSEAKMLINNYANLTLKGVTLAPQIPTDKTETTDIDEGMKGQTYYVLSNNCGEVNIEEGTVITAPTSSDNTNCPTVYAFDVCKYASYPNVTVNVKGATITGDVEYTGEGENQKLNITSGTINGKLVVKDGITNPAISVDASATVNDSSWDSYKTTTSN